MKNIKLLFKNLICVVITGSIMCQSVFCGVTDEKKLFDIGYGEGNCGFIYTLNKAITDEVRGIIENDKNSVAYSEGMFNYPIRIKYNYDKVTSAGYLYDQPWPFDNQESEAHAYTPDMGWSYPNIAKPSVGDVLKNEGKLLPEYADSDKYEGYEPKYDDVNFAECISILSNRDDYRYTEAALLAGLKRISLDKYLKYFYELEIHYFAVYEGSRMKADGTMEYRTKIFYVGTTDEEVKAYVDAKPEFDEDGFHFVYDRYFAKCRLKPFGLREEYMWTDIDPNEINQNIQSELKWTNYHILDRNEYYLRMYCRFDNKFQLDDSLTELPDDTYNRDILGVSYLDNRTKKSIIYEDIKLWLDKKMALIDDENDDIDTDYQYDNENDPNAINDMVIDPRTGEILDVPMPGDLVDCLEINTGLGYQAVRAGTDSYSMEFTLGKAADYNIIYSRILNAMSNGSGSNAGNSNEILSISKGGEQYYVGALVDGFAQPGCAYKVNLNNGTSFNMIAVDVKSLHDRQGSGGTRQVDTSYGHGYLSPDKKTVQMNICEFISANTSQKSIEHSSAINYNNTPVTSGTYVTSVESLGAF